MISVGISHFNKTFYKKEIRRAFVYCSAIIISTVLLIVIKLVTRTYNNHQIYSIYYSMDNMLAGLYYLCLNVCRLVLPSIPVIAFIFLLHSLQTRFGALNGFLRCISTTMSRTEDCLFPFCKSKCIPFVYLFRARLAVERNKRTKQMRTNDSISAVKFVGRQLSQLIKIMDQINFCCSFQVE